MSRNAQKYLNLFQNGNNARNSNNILQHWVFNKYLGVTSNRVQSSNLHHINGIP